MSAAAMHERLRAGLLEACAAPAAGGVPGTAAEGHLIRPLLALAGAGEDLPPGFWDAALAVQLAHEASLLHDDVIDGAAERRGEPTLAAAAGVARALVQGDHLLTAAYRAAVRTGSLPFATLFARAVERTVAAEVAQGRAAGQLLDRRRYDEIALGKAGELLGCALAAAPVLRGARDAEATFELGRRVGLLYQMLDDLLDYCPLARTGKPALGDYAQRRWTWVLEALPELPFGLPPREARAAFHRPAPQGSAAVRALAALEAEARGVLAALAARFPGDRLLGGLIGTWMEEAREAVRREAAEAADERVQTDGAVLEALRRRVPAGGEVAGYLAVHSRSFRFAARFFPREEAARVARVYAYCRITDDLVDRPQEGISPESLLEGWTELAARAYGGTPSGIPLLDAVMREMAAAGVPFSCASELAEGMRMDLRGDRYATLAELRRYTYRVASTVGVWMARLHGIADPGLLERAERMGHAMQLTNILRDVGEDLGAGRLYLPADLLRRHGVDEPALAAMRAGGPQAPGWPALVEELMAVAEEDYAAGLAVLPELPPSFARPVAVAAHVYRGIHADLRRRRYDNLRQRAYTPPLAKGVLAVRALWGLARPPRPDARGTRPALAVPGGGR